MKQEGGVGWSDLPLQPVYAGRGPGQLLLRRPLVEGDDVGEGEQQVEGAPQGRGQAARRDAAQQLQGTHGPQVLLPGNNRGWNCELGCVTWTGGPSAAATPWAAAASPWRR